MKPHCLFAAILLYAFDCSVYALVASPKAAETWGTDQCQTVACQFKAPNPQTPADVLQQWQTEDEALWKYVGEHVPDVLEHSGTAAFDEHLKGVQAVLRYWNAPPHLTKAGLFHSIYGTEGFQGFSLPLSQRGVIRSLIGERAEKLSFIFCMVDRSTVDRTVFDWSGPITDDKDGNPVVFHFQSRPELGRFPIEVSKEEWLDFVELTLADWLEQVEGAATKPSEHYLWKTGQAYAYRRTAYAKMSVVLSVERESRLKKVAPRMLDSVMATEAEEHRSLVQLRTPPQSQAAADALEALRASGEDIPADLSPQPLEECVPL